MQIKKEPELISGHHLEESMTIMKNPMKKISVLLLLSCAGYSLSAQDYAVTNYSVNYMRLEADYESPVETQELMGVPVRILETERYWKKVESPQPYKAWCTDMGLSYMDEEEVKRYIAAPKYIFTSTYGTVWSRPALSSEPVCDILMGDIVRISLNARGKAVRKNGFLEVLLPSGKKGFLRKNEVERLCRWIGDRRPDFSHIRKTALSFKGIPYLWGGMSVKGFDCSGLVRYTWMMNGVLLPRNASQQCHCGIQIEIGHQLPMEERIAPLLPGDLVFFGSPAADGKKERITHVAIYLGDGMIIHSSHEVRVNSLLPGREDSYANATRLIRACRILGQEDAGTGVLSMKKSPAYF